MRVPGRSSQSGDDTERNESLGLVFLHGLGQRLSAQTGIIVRLQQSHLDSSEQPGTFDGGVRLRGTVGDQLVHDLALVEVLAGVRLIVTGDGAGASRQQSYQRGLARRALDDATASA